MSATEAAEARGVTRQAASDAARIRGLAFRDGRTRPDSTGRGNPLVALSPEERADYDRMKRSKFTRNEALTAIGRKDLIR